MAEKLIVETAATGHMSVFGYDVGGGYFTSSRDPWRRITKQGTPEELRREAEALMWEGLD